jgi:hypothetical protein
MIRCGIREVRAPNFSALLAKTVECLRGCDFMNQVPVDVNQGSTSGKIRHDVSIPNLVK